MSSNTTSKDWRSIDNTGKIFPATSNSRDTRVFRVYCELNEEINPEYLSDALQKTIEVYPLFKSVIRKGLFWYYFEKSDILPKVIKEYEAPCSNIYVRDQKKLLFQVSYYENRINFETFHALTDGTGAVEFTRELVKNYILISHPDDTLSDYNIQKEDATISDYETDSFEKYYAKPVKQSEAKNKKAYQISGQAVEYGDLKLNEVVCSTRNILSKAKEYKVSATVLLTAALMCAINKERRANSNNTIGIMIPVNLRKYYQSDTMMNFFGWISPQYSFDKAGDTSEFEQCLETVKQCFANELTNESITAKMNTLVKIEKNPLLRPIPLDLKVLAMRLATRFSVSETTAVYSNVGVIHMPDEFSEYINRFGFFVSTPCLQLCTCSYQDNFTISITSGHVDENIQRNFISILKNIGITDMKPSGNYPERETKPYSSTMLVKLFTFIMIATSLSSVVLNVLITPSNLWSQYVVLGVVCTWIISMINYYKRRNPLKSAVWQQIILTGLCLLWDLMTGFEGWWAAIAFPIINVLTLIAITIISLAQKLKPENYIIYFFINCIIGIIPSILCLFYSPITDILCVISSTISIIVMFGFIIFGWNNVKKEFEKKFHL